MGDITIAEDVHIAAAGGIAAQVCDAVDVTTRARHCGQP